MKSYWFDPDKSFLKLEVLWFFIGGVGLLAGGVYLLIFFNEGGGSCYSAACVNQWAADYKVPIGILALLIPIIGLLNANHKSEQAREAMAQSRSQNLFSNYYKHLEEFEKYVTAGTAKWKQPVNVEARFLHRQLFPDAKTHGIVLSEDRQIVLLKRIVTLGNMIEGVSQYDTGSLETLVRDVTGVQREMLEDFDGTITHNRAAGTLVQIMGEQYLIPNHQISDLLKETAELFYVIVEIFSFDEHFKRRGQICSYLKRLERVGIQFPQIAFDVTGMAKTSNSTPFEDARRYIWNNTRELEKLISDFRYLPK